MANMRGRFGQIRERIGVKSWRFVLPLLGITLDGQSLRQQWTLVRVKLLGGNSVDPAQFKKEEVEFPRTEQRACPLRPRGHRRGTGFQLEA
jgi:hypothetical protein